MRVGRVTLNRLGRRCYISTYCKSNILHIAPVRYQNTYFWQLLPITCMFAFTTYPFHCIVTPAKLIKEAYQQIDVTRDLDVLSTWKICHSRQPIKTRAVLHSCLRCRSNYSPISWLSRWRARFPFTSGCFEAWRNHNSYEVDAQRQFWLFMRFGRSYDVYEENRFKRKKERRLKKSFLETAGSIRSPIIKESPLKPAQY